MPCLLLARFTLNRLILPPNQWRRYCGIGSLSSQYNGSCLHNVHKLATQETGWSDAAADRRRSSAVLSRDIPNTASTLILPVHVTVHPPSTRQDFGGNLMKLC